MLMKNLKYLFLIFCSFSIGQNVTVNSGATITVGSGKYISIAGNFSNAGTTTLNSSSNS